MAAPADGEPVAIGFDAFRRETQNEAEPAAFREHP
jgi:hypothetical protein